MANILDNTGLTTDSLQEIIESLTEGMREIYGNDINVDSNSPDGQFININALTVRDILTLLENIYSSFDPDQAQGVVLDQRVAINNIERNGATYTLQDIEVTIDQALNLKGLDGNADAEPAGGEFVVADQEGNEFVLLDSQSPIAAGTYTYPFRAKNLGAIETSINTINVIQTIVLGVLSVNNTTTQSILGQNEETDAQLRERRKKSPAIRSKASIDGIEANLLNLSGVSSARVYENFSNQTDANDLPPHSMYAVVEGGANTEIADVISKYRSVGSDMKGDVEVDVVVAGNSYEIKFDRPQGRPLHIRFGLRDIEEGGEFDLPAIKAAIVAGKTYQSGEVALADELIEVAKDAVMEVAGKGKGAIINLEISADESNWLYFIEASELKDKWLLAVENIDIALI